MAASIALRTAIRNDVVWPMHLIEASLEVLSAAVSPCSSKDEITKLFGWLPERTLILDRIHQNQSTIANLLGRKNPDKMLANQYACITSRRPRIAIEFFGMWRLENEDQAGNIGTLGRG